MRAALYSRVSSEERTLGFSLDGQLAAMRAYCHGQGWEIVVEFVGVGLCQSAPTTGLNSRR